MQHAVLSTVPEKARHLYTQPCSECILLPQILLKSERRANRRKPQPCYQETLKGEPGLWFLLSLVDVVCEHI